MTSVVLVAEATCEAVTPPVDWVIEPPEAAVICTRGRAEVQEVAEAGDEEASEHGGPASGVVSPRDWGAVGRVHRGLAITQDTVGVVIPPTKWK